MEFRLLKKSGHTYINFVLYFIHVEMCEYFLPDKSLSAFNYDIVNVIAMNVDAQLRSEMLISTVEFSRRVTFTAKWMLFRCRNHGYFARFPWVFDYIYPTFVMKIQNVLKNNGLNY